MADFRKLVIDLVAADGTISAAELRTLKKALYADNQISRDEMMFLVDLRNAVLKKTKTPDAAFDKFFLAALHDNILGNGIISAEEAGMAKKLVVTDKTLKIHAKKFLTNLKKKATTVAPEFDALLASVS